MAGDRLGRRAAVMALAAAALVLSACGTSQQAAVSSTAPKMANAPIQIGKYKVGRPYKVSGVWYYPSEDLNYDETGIASWYGPGFHGRKTANGERYNQHDLTAAHPTLPMPSLVRVTNLENGRSVDLRINDRGPFARSRIIDVSHRAAQLLGFEHKGTAKVRVRVLPEESRQLAALARGEVLPPAPGTLPGGDVQLAQAPASSSSKGVQSPPAQTAAANSSGTAPKGMPDGLIHIEPPKEANLFVQAGAFTDYQNASRLAAELQPHGLVQIEPAAISGQSFYRVRIGPVPSVDEADLLVARLISDGYTSSQVIVQ